MKNKVVISTLLFLFALTLTAQTDSIPKKHRHELGADITGLLQQFFHISSSQYPDYYYPTYYLSYRYHLKKSNIRFGIGGDYSKTTIGPYELSGVEQKLYKTSSNVTGRIGYERVSELSKKWQAFWGIDFRSSYSSFINPDNYSNGGYLNGTVSYNSDYALAPLLGFRFRITNRVSILTETSYSFVIRKYDSQTKYISVDNTKWPDKPDEKRNTGTNFGSVYSQPLSIIFVVDI